MSWASSRVSLAAAATTPVTRPSRSTVIVCEISSTSSSLWLMKIVVLPSAREVADDAEQALRLLGRQHGRGLVEDQDVGAPEERAQDLDPLQRPDGERRTRARRGRRRGRSAR